MVTRNRLSAGTCGTREDISVPFQAAYVQEVAHHL
jgi:hypothetical protein